MISETLIPLEALQIECKYIRDRQRFSKTLDAREKQTLLDSYRNSEGCCFTDGIVNWFAEVVAKFEPLQFCEHLVLRPSHIFVDSQHTARAIAHFRNCGKPDQDYQLEDSDWRRDSSLWELHRRCRGETLQSLVSWRKIAFILFDSDHFSTILLSRDSEISAVHYDSIPGTHKQIALDFISLLKACGLLPRSVPMAVPSDAAHQAGGWQCGPIVCAILYQNGAHNNKQDPVAAAFVGKQTTQEIAHDCRRFLNHIIRCSLASDLIACRFRRFERW